MGWMGGQVGFGWSSQFKDCLQQYKMVEYNFGNGQGRLAQRDNTHLVNFVFTGTEYETTVHRYFFVLKHICNGSQNFFLASMTLTSSKYVYCLLEPMQIKKFF